MVRAETGPGKIKGTRDEPGLLMVSRLTKSNYQHVKFYIKRKTDNVHVAKKVSSITCHFSKKNTRLLSQNNSRKIQRDDK